VTSSIGLRWGISIPRSRHRTWIGWHSRRIRRLLQQRLSGEQASPVRRVPERALRQRRPLHSPRLARLARFRVRVCPGRNGLAPALETRWPCRRRGPDAAQRPARHLPDARIQPVHAVRVKRFDEPGLHPSCHGIDGRERADRANQPGHGHAVARHGPQAALCCQLMATPWMICVTL